MRASGSAACHIDRNVFALLPPSPVTTLPSGMACGLTTSEPFDDPTLTVAIVPLAPDPVREAQPVTETSISATATSAATVNQRDPNPPPCDMLVTPSSAV